MKLLDNLRPDWKIPKYSTDIIDLSNNICYDSVLIDKINYIINSVDFDVRQYSDEYPLYDAISKYHSVPIEHISLGFGLGEIIQRFFNRHQSVAIVSPTWTMPEIFGKVRDARVEIIKELKVTDCDILYVATPNGVTGQTCNSQLIKKLCNHYKLIIVDEAYGEWADFESLINESIKTNIVVLKTLSKSLSVAGLRIGYAIANKENTIYLQTHRPSCVTTSINTAIAGMLFDLIPEHINRMKQTKHYLENNFNCIPTQTNFVIFKNPPKGINNFLTKKLDFGTRMALCDLELVNCLK